MPVDPNNPYNDTPHPKTVIGAGYRYGCHSDKLGTEPRGRNTTSLMQDGWRWFVRKGETTREPIMVAVTSQWIPRACGHNENASDPACTGCFNRGKNND